MKKTSTPTAAQAATHRLQRFAYPAALSALALGVLAACGGGSNNLVIGSLVTPTPTPGSNTNTPVPGSSTYTPVPVVTNTAAPGATAVPVPTNTSIPGSNTNTPVPGSNTHTPTPTPTRTNTPTNTNTPTATNTSTATNTPTNTNTPTATQTLAPGVTATNTAAPTATNTAAPTATNTAAPTATNTAAPTATNTAAPTATNTPAPTATNTPAPTATNTPAPTATNTPAPTATNTPAPTATNTPAPTLPAALEACPASNPVEPAPPVQTALTVETSAGWANGTGQLSAVANGTRTGRESGLRSGVNCVSWKDANGKARALNLGAYLFDYVMNWGATRYVATDDAAGHPGFGYVVSHNNQNGNSPLGSFMDPSSVKTTVFAGANHAIHRVTLNYTRDTEAGGQGIVVPVVIEWMVAAGRNDPVWAVNWKMNQAQNPQGVNFNTYRMDSRGPYGSIGWDGKTHSSGQDLAVLGVEWGAGGYEFQAVRMGGLNSGAGWNYQLLSPINYAKAFPIETVPVEFGIVQTKRDPFMGYPDGVGGRLEGKTSPTYGKACAATNTYMPCAQDWPYQMMQYSAPDGSFSNMPTTGKLMAWGTPYGYLGADTVNSFDYNFTTAGTGERSYATYIVWGETGAVDTSQNPVEAAKHYADAASYWTTTQAIGGIGAVATTATLPGSEQARTLPANGYNETYGAFEFIVTADNRADIRIMNMGQANTGTVLRRPVLVFNNYNGGVPQLKLGVTPLVSGVDYLASYDTASHRLWVTLMYDAIAQQGFHVVLN